MKYTILLSPVFLVLLSCGGNASKDDSKPPATVNPDSARISEVIGIGKVEPEAEIVNLAATAGGIVVKVYKGDGETVRAGEPLVLLDDAIEKVRIAQARAQVKTQQAQVNIDEDNLREQEVNLLDKRRRLGTARNLLSKGAETKDAVDQLETDVNALEATVDAARARIRQSRQRIAELQEDIRLAETEAGQKTIRAPSNGTILDMQVSAGESLSQYATYAEFAPEGRLVVRAEVDELFSDKIQPGMPVDIRYTGTSQLLARGSVTSVAPYLKKKSLFSVKADDQEDRRVREIRVTLPDSAKLTINTKVECIIKLRP
jgi:multidrug resistance efflux pump